MEHKNRNIDEKLLDALREDKHDAFIQIFGKYYADLVIFASSHIPEKSTCEDIVQNIFLRLWENRHDIDIHTSIKSFLLKCVRNACLDELRHRKIVNQYADTFDNALWEYSTENYILYSDLRRRYHEAINQLTPNERQILTLSRGKGIRYTDIASALGISVRTVETRVAKALQHLRQLLKEFRQ